ncbi:protein kinase [Nocardiopsis sp. NPDC101807]|uniref:protein kinase domain-containing protein n=1 Tax=Nocardiopsis sp. NPDC101807 TaxID=3364339 RepID=UPI0037F13906
MSSTGSGGSLVPGFHSLEVLHRGASSTVYRAVPDAGGDPVAVKVLRGPDGGAESERARRLSGVPGVVRVLGHGSTTSGRPFVAMELHGGGDYGRILADRRPLPADEVVRVGLDVAGALAGVHALGLLHHAVEPSNVLAGEGRAVLADAGAVLPGGALPPPAGPRTGALLHAPPEAVRGEPPTAASDVYRLAATLWELLAGRPPFGDGAEAAADPFGYRERVLGGGVPGPPRPGLPAPLVAALARALDRDPGNRYADAEGFAAALAPDGAGAAGAAPAAPARGGVADAPGSAPPPAPPVAGPPPTAPGAVPGPGAASADAGTPAADAPPRPPAGTGRASGDGAEPSHAPPRTREEPGPERGPGADTPAADAPRPGRTGARTVPGSPVPDRVPGPDAPAARTAGRGRKAPGPGPVPAAELTGVPDASSESGAAGRPGRPPADGPAPAGPRAPGTAPRTDPAPPPGDDADPWQGLVEWEPPRAAPAAPPPAPAFGPGTAYADPAAQAPHRPATGGPAPDRGSVPPPGARDAGERRSRRLRLAQVAVSSAAIVVIALGLAAFVYPGQVAALLASVGLVEPGEDPAPAPVDPSSAPHAAVSRESAPTDVGVEDSGGAVVLTWTDNAGEGTPHHVVGGPAGGAYTALAEAGPGAAQARVTGLDAGEYCFVVIAVLSADEVAPSEEACAELGAG